MKILACSDIHVGRIPSIPVGGLTGRSVWNCVVDTAISLAVDLVVIAGDVVEQDNAWFEAYGALATGLSKLHAAGIPVCVVAGNHDSVVLPKLAAEYQDSLVLLGQGGLWSHADFGDVRVVGWSFPSNHTAGNPLDQDLSLCTAGWDGPVVGLLHCDVDGSQTASPYAPVPSSAFAATTIPLWILGHIHGFGQRAQGLAWYCGSPWPLDPSETGNHGVLLLETSQRGFVSAPTFHEISPYRFVQCMVDLEGAVDINDVEQRVASALRTIGKIAAEEGYNGEIWCDLVLHGALDASVSYAECLEPSKLEGFTLQVGNVIVRPSGVVFDHTTIALDMDMLSKSSSVAGTLARLVLEPKHYPELMQAAQTVVEEASTHAAYRQLGRSMDDVDPAQLLAEAGKRLLKTMLGTREE